MRCIATLLVSLLFCACSRDKLFTLVSSGHTGISFNNRIVETDSINPLNNVNIYNGGGVGIGDFNGDSLPDIYFTGNMVPNKLYLNRGGLKFEDITATAKVDGKGKWCRGASVVDINGDGKLDLYVAASMSPSPEQRRNLLYINSGNNDKGIPQFAEQASAWGLDDTTHTTMAHFFDYDKDGDLDVYLVVNQHLRYDDPNRFRPIITDGSHPSTGRLYRNDWNDSLDHGYFTDISLQAGITTEGYSHAAIINDFNKDGWKDIYVTNDFLSANILYINNGDGTFADQAKDYFRQTSTFAMGVDIGDINNDGWIDLAELDMNPQDNYRKKMMLGANSYQTMQNFDRYGYQYQYSKNSLQLNMGYTVGANDSTRPPIFSQIAYLAGVAETDWSWTPVLADFDDDGYRDLFITNGYPKDVTDRDFMTYRDRAYAIATTQDIMRQIPEVKLHNYVFRNNGDLTFADESAAWGLEQVSFSNGAASADLDGDGDLDLVVNNINDEAFIYQNNALAANPENHFLNITLYAEGANKNALGSSVSIFYGGGQQVHEYTPYRGYLSSSENLAHFGLGAVDKIDSVVVVWPNDQRQVVANVTTNQLLRIRQESSLGRYSYELPVLPTLFTDVTAEMGIQLVHHQKDFIDFNVQRLLPHKLSAYAPALAAGDIDGDGLDDIVCGGTATSGITALLQKEGKFLVKKIVAPQQVATADGYDKIDYAYKDAGLLLFDADGDGDVDLYASSGGYEHAAQTAAYQDRLYVNDGKGNFQLLATALPLNVTSKACVRAADIDKDGDLDLFVAGRVDPWHYPRPLSSFIFRNDSQKGTIKFTDITATIAPDLVDIGMACDGLFSDFDNDGWPDLVIAGEWMPLTFLKNRNGKFEKTKHTGVEDQTGWWNTLAPGDFDNDGDIDYVAGNAGWNSFYKASATHPVSVTAADFDKNGSFDAFISLYLPASQKDTARYEFTAHSRDDVNKQMISMRSRFLQYRPFALATMEDMFTPEERKQAVKLQAVTMGSALLLNEGNGTFTIRMLPVLAQASVLCGMAVIDVDGDGNLDIIANGNDYGTDVSVGRHDALNGLLLKGDGKGGFEPQTIARSGIFIPGDGKALVQLRHQNGQLLLAASQHNGPVKMFGTKKGAVALPAKPDDATALIYFKDGRKQKQEAYFGSSFLSQSTRNFIVGHPYDSIKIIGVNGSAQTILSQ